MEKQLFEWEGWDQQDTMLFTFYKVVLNTPIGNFVVGTKFDYAMVDYENGTLKLYNSPGSNGNVDVFDFKLQFDLAAL